MSLDLNGILLGSENPKALADFYTKILGKPTWEAPEGWYGYTIGSGGLGIGPHSEVKGKNQSPGRIMMMFETSDVKDEFARIQELGAEVIAEPYHPGDQSEMLMATFADPDGNYFQLASPMKG